MNRVLAIQSIFYAIAMIAGNVGASTGFSGWLRMDATLDHKINNSQNVALNEPARWDITRARLRYTHNWSGWVNQLETVIELHLDTEPTSFVKNSFLVQSQSLSLKTQLSQAYAAYRFNKNIFKAGLIEAPSLSQEISCASLGFDQPIGTIIGFGGYHLGMTYELISGPYSGVFGVWQQGQGLSSTGGTYQSIQNFAPVTETVTPSFLEGAVAPDTNLDPAEVSKSFDSGSFSSKYIPFSFGGRANYYFRFRTLETWGVSLAAAHQKLSYPLVLAVLYDPYVPSQVATVDQEAIAAQGAYRLTSFKSMNHYHLECLRTIGPFRASAGYSEQVLPRDVQIQVITNDTQGGTPTQPVAPYVLEDGGRVFGYYIEAGHLLFGKGFNVDRSKNSVSSIVLGNQGWGLEIGARWGLERRRNILALMDMVGADDFSASVYRDTSGAGRLRLHGIEEVNGSRYQIVCVDNQSPNYIDPLVEKNGTLFGLGSVTEETKSFQTLATGFAFFLQYYPADAISIKAEFDWKNYQKRIYLRDNNYSDSIHFKNIHTFKLRIESVF